MYSPELDTSIEVGFKGDFNLGGMRMRANAALFHDDYAAIQKHVTIVSPTGSSYGITLNVAASEIQGLELETIFQPTENLTIGVDYAFTDSHYEGSTPGGPNNPCDPTAALVVGFCSSNRISYLPKNKIGVTANYKLPLPEEIGDVSVGGHLAYQSSVALNDTSALNPEAVQSGYTTLDLNASWTQIMGRPVDLTFFITNVTDKLYRAGSDDLLQTSSLGIQPAIWAPDRELADEAFGATLKRLIERHRSKMAEDRDGAPVFLVADTWTLQHTIENSPGIRFHEICERA